MPFLLAAAALLALATLGPIGGDPTGEAPVSAPAEEIPDPPSGGDRNPLWSGDGFPIARMREGARVTVHARPGGRAVERVGAKTEFGSVRTFAITHRRGPWLRVATEVSRDNGDLWVRASRRKMDFSTTPTSVHADLGERRVEVRSGGRPVLSFGITIGSPSSPTPTGLFAVTDLIVGNHRPVYGCCVVALSARQPNLPDDWIGGDRVAFHGTSGRVGQASSLGCMRATDDDMRKLIHVVPLGAPVFITG